MPDAPPLLSLLADRHRRVKAGHPWIYSNEIAMVAEAKALPPGTLVRVAAASGEDLGRFLFNPRTLIAARRIAEPGGGAIDAEFLAARIDRAKALRETLYPAPYYRLVHAEADGLPGVVVDRYGDVLVAEISSAGMARLETALLEALRRVIEPRAIVLRADGAARALEGLPAEPARIIGTIDGPVELIENGSRFQIDPAGGQKTGWFFDQRENRAQVAALAKGARVCDLFCYAGGFGIQALMAGAEHALLVDRSALALETARQGAALNHVAARADFRAGDVFAVLEDLAARGERFDIVVADPPAFVKSKKDLAVGLKAYRKLNRLAAALVAPGGYLFSASCSHNVETQAFGQEVRAGVQRAGRGGRVLREAGAAPDHPAHLFLPETAYLKALLLQLD